MGLSRLLSLSFVRAKQDASGLLAGALANSPISLMIILLP